MVAVEWNFLKNRKIVADKGLYSDALSGKFDMSKWWPGSGHSVRETDLSICIFDRQTLCPVGKTGLEWLFLFFSDRLAKLHRCHPENRFTLFGMGFGYRRILSENRFTLFGMGF